MGERPVPIPGVDMMFTDEDLDEILDYIEYELTLCNGCGLPKAETFDPANEWAYEPVVLQCAACKTTRHAERKLDDHAGIYAFPIRKQRPAGR